MEFDSTPLTTADRHALLRLARESIAAGLRGARAPQLPAPSAGLMTPRGVFVSLHVYSDLRGCVGTLTSDRPLHESVVRLAVVAAFDDPRFAPLSEAELPQTDIEISRLTTPQPTHAAEIVIGRDGVCVTLGERRGLLLPQVAREHGWDAERLLSEACRKAQLPATAWRLPGCELLRFEAEIFSDQFLADR